MALDPKGLQAKLAIWFNALPDGGMGKEHFDALLAIVLQHAGEGEAPDNGRPYREGDLVVTHHFDEVLTVEQCFDAVGGWRVIAKGKPRSGNPTGKYDFPVSDVEPAPHAGEGEAEPVAWQRGERDLALRWIARLLAKLGSIPDHADDCLWLDRLHSLLAAAPHPQQASEGWVLVPREPTPEMLISGRAAFDRPGSGGRFSEVYRAMLAASPSSADQGGE